MGRRFTVMGFTEAELGFALAAFFVAVGAGYLNERNQLDRSQGVVVVQRDSLQSALDSLRREYRLLRDSVRLRSRLMPSCAEKGEADTSIATFTILAGDRYELGGDEMTFDEVKARLEAPLARSKKLGCRYSVESVAPEGLDARQFSRANARLRGLFYLRER